MTKRAFIAAIVLTLGLWPRTSLASPAPPREPDADFDVARAPALRAALRWTVAVHVVPVPSTMGSCTPAGRSCAANGPDLDTRTLRGPRRVTFDSFELGAPVSMSLGPVRIWPELQFGMGLGPSGSDLQVSSAWTRIGIALPVSARARIHGGSLGGFVEIVPSVVGMNSSGANRLVVFDTQLECSARVGGAIRMSDGLWLAALGGASFLGRSDVTGGLRLEWAFFP